MTSRHVVLHLCREERGDFIASNRRLHLRNACIAARTFSRVKFNFNLRDRSRMKRQLTG